MVGSVEIVPADSTIVEVVQHILVYYSCITIELLVLNPIVKAYTQIYSLTHSHKMGSHSKDPSTVMLDQLRKTINI